MYVETYEVVLTISQQDVERRERAMHTDIRRTHRGRQGSLRGSY